MAATATALPLDTILHGDCLDLLRTLPDASVDAVVTDPPAGIAFMGKTWDANKGGRAEWIAWLAEIMREALRVLKPGGHALVWALPRTSHWTAMALEDAGFEIRDRVAHIFGQGFPKSLNLHGEREGWGTALKPAVEDWWLCRKPLAEPNVAANVLRYGTGALNIAASRVACDDKTPLPKAGYGRHATDASYQFAGDPKFNTTGPDKNPAGRWPAHLVLSHSTDCTDGACVDGCPVRELDAQSGERSMGHVPRSGKPGSIFGNGQHRPTADASNNGYGDSGGASRFYPTFRYVAKASRRERNAGCEGLLYRTPGEATGRKEGSAGLNSPRAGAGRTAGALNSHPTVKPIALMEWLITLITPPGGGVLDPFAGSGTTCVAAKRLGMRYIGIEREAEYVAIARARLAGETTQVAQPKPATKPRAKPKAKPVKRPRAARTPPTLWEASAIA